MASTIHSEQKCYSDYNGAWWWQAAHMRVVVFVIKSYKNSLNKNSSRFPLTKSSRPSIRPALTRQQSSASRASSSFPWPYFLAQRTNPYRKYTLRLILEIYLCICILLECKTKSNIRLWCSSSVVLFASCRSYSRRTISVPFSESSSVDSNSRVLHVHYAVIDPIQVFFILFHQAHVYFIHACHFSLNRSYCLLHSYGLFFFSVLVAVGENRKLCITLRSYMHCPETAVINSVFACGEISKNSEYSKMLVTFCKSGKIIKM